MGDHGMRDDPIAAALTALARDVAFPPAPPLAPAVTERLLGDRATGRRPAFPGLALWSRRRLLVAVALGLLAALGIAAAARFAIGAFEIRVQPGVTADPSLSPVEPGDLGAPASVREAEAAVGFDLALPPGDPPDEVHVVERLGDGPGIVVAWGPGAGAPALDGTGWSLLLMAFPGEADVGLKTVERPEAIRETSVGGRRAFWIDVPHVILLETDDGVLGPYRVEGNVLIWDTAEGITYRMETVLPRTEAIALAESLR